MNETRVIALTQPRHACHACGNCCFGHRISLFDEAESALVEAHGRALGVENPVVDGALRTVDGHCVFLGADRLCTIHGTFGGDKKPKVCQQYPVRLSRAEDGLRVGIDPGCTSNWKVWRDGPAVDVSSALEPHNIVLSAPDAATGKALLGMAQSKAMDVARFVWVISGGQPPMNAQGDPLPHDFSGRLIDRLKALRIDRFIGDPEVGEGIRLPLAHLPEFIAGLDRESPPDWLGQLPPDMDEFVLEVVRRSLFMRLNDPDLPVVGHVLLLLSGAVACAWADPTPEVFGPALSTWARACRYRAFWQGFFPRSETISWLATGHA